MAFPKPKSTTAATDEEYATQFRRLLTRFQLRNPNSKGRRVLVDLVDDVIALKPGLKWNSFRKYRASVRLALTTLIEKNSGNEALILVAQEAMRRSDQTTSEGCLKKSRSTSALKARNISDQDYNAIIARLAHNPGRSSLAAPALSGATVLLLTGCRPIELAQLALIQVDADAIEVIVQTAKATNDRGLDGERKLLLRDLTTEEVNLALAWPNHFKMLAALATPLKVIRKLSVYFNETGRKVLGARKKYPCFSTFRHQLTADMKFSGMKPEEIGAVLGHSASGTALRHYARKNTGKGKVRVSPDPNLVAKVRQTASTYAPHLRGSLPFPGL